MLACVNHLMGRIARDFVLQPGPATAVSELPRLLQHRAGACQDFAHLMLAGLRALGLPARYVSGYGDASRRPAR